jgi:hypothetical protein
VSTAKIGYPYLPAKPEKIIQTQSIEEFKRSVSNSWPESDVYELPPLLQFVKITESEFSRGLLYIA